MTIRKKAVKPPLPESKFEPLRSAAARLSLNECTVRQGRGGTSELVKIRQGGRVFLIRAQVSEHIENMIKAAQAQHDKPLDRVWRR